MCRTLIEIGIKKVIKLRLLICILFVHLSSVVYASMEGTVWKYSIEGIDAATHYGFLNKQVYLVSLEEMMAYPYPSRLNCFAVYNNRCAVMYQSQFGSSGVVISFFNVGVAIQFGLMARIPYCIKYKIVLIKDLVINGNGEVIRVGEIN